MVNWVGGISSAHTGPDSRTSSQPSSQPFGQGIGTVTPVRLGQGYRAFGSGGLNRLPGVHPRPIKRVFYPGPLPPGSPLLRAGNLEDGRLFLGAASGLDAFSPYQHAAWLPDDALSDNRYTIGCSILFLSY